MRYATEREDDGAARVALSGDLDMAATFSLEQELDRLIDPEVQRVFEMAGLAELLPFVDA